MGMSFLSTLFSNAGGLTGLATRGGGLSNMGGGGGGASMGGDSGGGGGGFSGGAGSGDYQSFSQGTGGGMGGSSTGQQGFWGSMGSMLKENYQKKLTDIKEGKSSPETRQDPNEWMKWGGGSLSPKAKTAMGGDTTPATTGATKQPTLAETIENIRKYRDQRRLVTTANTPTAANYPMSSEATGYDYDDVSPLKTPSPTWSNASSYEY